MRLCLLTLLILIGFGGSARGQEPAKCPSLKVIGPSGITMPGDNVTFVVDTNADTKVLKFYWTVSDGVIEEGQGTTTIKVRTSREDEGETIEAKVSVSGFPKGCQSAAIETAALDTVPVCGLVTDEFGDLEPNDIRARLDSFFIDLFNNPTNTGFIVLQIMDDEELSESNPRLQLLVQHIKFREFDPDRIRFMFEPVVGSKTSYTPSTRWYRVLPGAVDPPCEKCIEVHPIPLQ